MTGTSPAITLKVLSWAPFGGIPASTRAAFSAPIALPLLHFPINEDRKMF
jgi:hypothetical protein